jgi:two-component system, LytTR family, response regulator LytT
MGSAVSEAIELAEEVVQLERRSAYRPRSLQRVVARRNKSLVFLDAERIWAFEAVDRLTFVHAPEGRFDIDVSLTAIEASVGCALFRVHRNWLVHLAYVKELGRDSGGATVTVGNDLGPDGRSIRAPVSRHRAKALREVLLRNATGLRRP